MRDVKFRGYAVEEMVGSQWQYGTGIHVTEFTDEFAKEIGKKEECLVWTISGWFEVKKDSIGQYTGLKDKNGVEIYEGDILKLTLISWCDIEEDVFSVRTESFHADICYLKAIGENSDSDSMKIIGNVFENPELLEVTN